MKNENEVCFKIQYSDGWEYIYAVTMSKAAKLAEDKQRRSGVFKTIERIERVNY